MLKKFHMPSLLFGSSLIFIFGIFSFIVDKDFLRQFDFNTTVRLQDNIPRRIDIFFSWFSEIGSFEFMLVALFGLIVIFLMHKKILAAISAFVCFGMFHVVELFGKSNVEQLPPPHFMLRTEQLMEFPQFHIRQEYSYPSGHAGRAFFLSTILIIMILQSKRLSFPVKVLLIAGLLGYDLVMVISRVYLGEHWATDVIGGALLGIALGFVTGTFFVGAKNMKGLLPKFKVEIKRLD